jgi:hypothetical protein
MEPLLVLRSMKPPAVQPPARTRLLESSYGDTFAPTSKSSCVRTICALAAQEGLTLYKFDVKGAFLNAPCSDEVYLNFPGNYKLPLFLLSAVRIESSAILSLAILFDLE